MTATARPAAARAKSSRSPRFRKASSRRTKNATSPTSRSARAPGHPASSTARRDGQGAAAVVCCIGGTSIGAPAWAGISQLISQANGAPVGNLNTRIYQLGAEANGATTGIRDVTSGNTNYNGVTGFSALPGYDKASGWGTVDMGLFVPAYLGP